MAKINKRTPSEISKELTKTLEVGRKVKATFKRTEGEGEDAKDMTYGIIPPRIEYNGKVYSAEELAKNSKIQNELLDAAWAEYDEEDFELNGIFKIIY